MFKFFNLLITFVSLGIKTIKTLLLLLAHKLKYHPQQWQLWIIR